MRAISPRAQPPPAIVSTAVQMEARKAKPWIGPMMVTPVEPVGEVLERGRDAHEQDQHRRIDEGRDLQTPEMIALPPSPVVRAARDAQERLSEA